MSNRTFTHIIDDRAAMVDISEKGVVVRRAVAEGRINLSSETIAAISEGSVEKGNVLATARVAAITAVKKTPFIIPMCHQIPITSIDVNFEVIEDMGAIDSVVEVKSVGRTGVEMDALCGVSVALLTIWDMVKSKEKDETGNYPATAISDIRVLEKVKD